MVLARPFGVSIPMSCAYLTDLATSIWNDLGQPTDLSVAAIQTKLGSAAFLGKFNSLTANCYTIDSNGNIVPELGLEEQGIYSLMYQVDYYTGKLNNALNGFNTSFISIADGDSRIVRANQVEVARMYRDQQKNLAQQLSLLIGSYRSGNAGPLAVDMYTIISTLGGGYSGPTRGYYRS